MTDDVGKLVEQARAAANNTGLDIGTAWMLLDKLADVAEQQEESIRKLKFPARDCYHIEACPHWVEVIQENHALKAAANGRLLTGRDEFIVSKGLWQEFVDGLPDMPTNSRSTPPKCPECGQEATPAWVRGHQSGCGAGTRKPFDIVDE